METVIKCEKKGTWKNKEGKELPIYNVEFSNGIVAEAYKMIPVNTAIDQCVFEDTKYGKKVKMIGQPSSGGNYQKSKQQYLHPSVSLATMCLSYCKDLVIAEKISFDQILASADKMYNWAKGKEQS